MTEILLITAVTASGAERLAGAFAGTGVRVDAVYPAGHALAYSRHVARHLRYSGFAPIGSLRRAIAASSPRLLVACDDQAVFFLAALHKAANPHETALLDFSFGARPLSPALSSRAQAIGECARAGIKVADMQAVNNRIEVAQAVEWLGTPCLVKSDSDGEDAVIANNRAAACNAYAKLARGPSRLRSLAHAVTRGDANYLCQALFPRRPGIGLQRYVSGRMAVSAIACWQGSLVAANHFDVLASQKHKGPASVVGRSECAKMQAAAQKVVAHFGLTGFYGLEFIRDRGGDVHLTGIVPGATPTHHLALDSDPVHALLTAAGIAAHPRPVATGLCQIALFPQEWRRDAASGFLATAFHDLPLDDPQVIKALAGTKLAAAMAPAAGGAARSKA